jgi:hypothetical protein
MEPMYLLVKTDDVLDNIPNIRVFFAICGWSIVRIEERYYQLIIKFGIHYYELTKDDVMGFKSFGESRSFYKVELSDDEEDLDANDYDVKNLEENIKKVAIPVTERKFNAIINSMKLFAKILLEEEFDKKFEKLRYTFSKLELKTWDKQLEEVIKYNNGEDTPFLTLLAEAKQITIEQLVSAINFKVDEYNLAVQNLFINLTQLKTEFNTTQSIEDINVLYAKYFGQIFRISPEYRQAHPDIFDENGEFKFTIPLAYNF